MIRICWLYVTFSRLAIFTVVCSVINNYSTNYHYYHINYYKYYFQLYH